VQIGSSYDNKLCFSIYVSPERPGAFTFHNGFDETKPPTHGTSVVRASTTLPVLVILPEIHLHSLVDLVTSPTCNSSLISLYFLLKTSIYAQNK
jgi:hypothetical protein